MKYIFLIVVVVAVFFSCKKKDTYGYTCRCHDNVTGKADTVYAINTETSGEATYRCKDYADTANAHGKNIKCTID